MNATALGAPTPDSLMWTMVGGSIKNTSWYSCIGVVLQGMIVSAIVSKTTQYSEYFTKSDSIYLLEAIGLGAFLSVGTLALTCAETYLLVYETPSNVASTFRTVMMCDMAHLIVGAVFNLAAGAYYAYRAWKMSRENWWLVPPFVAGLLAQFIVAIVAVAHGFKIPKLDTLAQVKELATFMPSTIRHFKTWGAITLAVDGSLCVFMSFMLFKSRQGIFHNETRLFKKLLSLVYETMLPPAVCLLILEASSGVSGSPLTDARRIITCILPVLYFHSVLQTPVGRQQVRDILDSKLAADGVNLLSDERTATRNGGYSTTPRVYASFAKQGAMRKLEEEEAGGEGYELKYGGMSPVTPMSREGKEYGVERART
ncbi:hypothetical protein IAT38_006538 [Cryptococcus sp. DSM 104549]